MYNTFIVHSGVSRKTQITAWSMGLWVFSCPSVYGQCVMHTCYYMYKNSYIIHGPLSYIDYVTL